MSRNQTQTYPMMAKRGHQRGSALVIGIFVITVMFLLASALLRVLEDGDEQVTLEVWGTRAIATANSGADVAMAQLFPLSGGIGSCLSNSTWTPPNIAGFHACGDVQLTCSTATIGSVNQYRISSTATCQSGNCDSGATASSRCIRVSRTVEVEARAE